MKEGEEPSGTTPGRPLASLHLMKYFALSCSNEGRREVIDLELRCRECRRLVGNGWVTYDPETGEVAFVCCECRGSGPGES